MSTKIRVLDEQTINQIAAGEVVENPASVVKELVENAIDAQSTTITVTIHGGGHFLIRVVDNGNGMSYDDALLAFERHATSKIRRVDDLDQVLSMGFRGEALASIAAVSKVGLLTADDKGAVSVSCQGGKVLKREVSCRKQGTTFEVRSLFFNTPARKNFQKGESASTKEIVKMLTKLSLAHPSISFTLRSGEKTLLQTGNNPDKRILEVLGKSFTEDVRSIDYQKDQYSIKGVIGNPNNVSCQRSRQYLFVNHRPVICNAISKSVQEALGTRMGMREYPIFALWLEIPADKVDVNVHPQKTQVRFQEEVKIDFLIKEAIEQAFSFADQKTFVQMPVFSPKKNQNVFTSPSVSRSSVLQSQKEPTLVLQPKPRSEKPDYQFLTSLGKYAFFQEKISLWDDPEIFIPKMLLMDTRKAESRLHFEAVLENLEKEKEIPMQALLFAEKIQCTEDESFWLKDHLKDLGKIGIQIAPLKENAFSIEAIFPFYDISLVKKVLLSLKKDMPLQDIAKELVTKTRKKSISPDEMQVLLNRVLESKNPYYAPNGDVILRFLREEELEKILEGKQHAILPETV